MQYPGGNNVVSGKAEMLSACSWGGTSASALEELRQFDLDYPKPNSLTHPFLLHGLMMAIFAGKIGGTLIPGKSL